MRRQCRSVGGFLQDRSLNQFDLDRLGLRRRRVSQLVRLDHLGRPQRVGQVHDLLGLAGEVIARDERVLAGDFGANDRATLVVIDAGGDEQRVVLVDLDGNDGDRVDHLSVGLRLAL